MSSYRISSTTAITTEITQSQNNFIAFDSYGYVYYLKTISSVIRRQLVFDANGNVSSLGTSDPITLGGTLITSMNVYWGICIGLAGTNTTGYIFLSTTDGGNYVYKPDGIFQGRTPISGANGICMDPFLSNTEITAYYKTTNNGIFYKTISDIPRVIEGSPQLDNVVLSRITTEGSQVLAIGPDRIVYGNIYNRPQSIRIFRANTTTVYEKTLSRATTYAYPFGLAVNSANNSLAIYSNNGGGGVAVDIYTMNGTTADTKTFTYRMTLSGANSMGSTTGAGSPVIFYSNSFFCATYSSGSLNLVQIKPYAAPTSLTLIGSILSWTNSDTGITYRITNHAGTILKDSITITSCDMSGTFVPSSIVNTWYVNAIFGSTVVATSAPFYPPFPFTMQPSYNYSTTLSRSGPVVSANYFVETLSKDDLTTTCLTDYTITITGNTITCTTSVSSYRDFSSFFLNTINNGNLPHPNTRVMFGENTTISEPINVNGSTRVITRYSHTNNFNNHPNTYRSIMLQTTSVIEIDITRHVCSPGFTFVNTIVSSTVSIDQNTLDSNFVLRGIIYNLYKSESIRNFGIHFVFLPDPALYNGKMFFIKDKTNNAGNNPIYIIPPTNVTIDGSNHFIITANSGCLTLRCDGANYLIVNYYPSNKQPIVQRNTGSSYNYGLNTRKPAIVNTINVFNVNDSPDRSNLIFTNAVNLPNPTPGTPAMCIIVYAGDANGLDSRRDTHPLYLVATNSIDGIAGNPYIYTDGNKKSSGIVLITEGTTWYIAGWMWGDRWQWDGENTAGNYTDIPLHNGFLQVTNAGARNQILYAASTSCLKIIKITNASTFQQYSVKNANNPSITNVYLNTTNSTSPANYSLSYRDSNVNSCIWFACHVSGGNTYYYPIIGYTPNT